MKCTICGTENDVHKVKHLPLSEGRTGHVTLTDWTEYCVNCMRQQGDLFTKQMDEFMNGLKKQSARS